MEIENDDAALLESPCALIVGTVDATGLPEATRAWGAQVLPGGAHVRLILAADAEIALENVRSTKVLAVTATDVPTLVSVQVKGKVVAAEPETDADRDLREAFIAGFIRIVNETDATPVELLARIRPSGFVAVVMTVDEAYDQTPGPGAGRRRVGANR